MSTPTRNAVSLLAHLLLVCFVICLSDDVVADQPYADEPETIRLNDGAAASGWLGRMPRGRRKSLLKPITPSVQRHPILTAPPEPADVIVVPNRNVNRTENPAAEVAPKAVRKKKNLPPVATPVRSPAVSKSSAGDFVPRRISQSAVTPEEENSDDADGTQPESTSADSSRQDADDDLTRESVANLFRPLRTTSLATALKTQRGEFEGLRVPVDKAAEVYDSFGSLAALPTVVADGTVWNCDYPIFYNPLYFEDPNMERCGISHGCFTEAAAVLRFFGRIPVVPYLVGSNPPQTCVRSLGTCELCEGYGLHAYLPPLNVPGVATQAVATVGLIFLLP